MDGAGTISLRRVRDGWLSLVYLYLCASLGFVVSVLTTCECAA